MPPETPVTHRDLRGHSDAHRCCGRSLIGTALVRFSVRPQARAESISKALTFLMRRVVGHAYPPRDAHPLASLSRAAVVLHSAASSSVMPSAQANHGELCGARSIVGGNPPGL